MKKQLLRLLPVAAVLLTASCTDDQYDISNVDTESRFTAKGLVIPLNMSPIMLDNIISLNEDGDVKKDEKGNYYFYKKGKEPFESDNINVKKITITKPNDISQDITVTIALPSEIQTKWEQYAPEKTIGEILSNSTLRENIKIDSSTPIFSLTFNESNTKFNMNAESIDEKITEITKLGLDPLPMNLEVRLGTLNSVVSTVKINNLNVVLPSGMTIIEPGIYTTSTGELKYNVLEVPVGTTTTIATLTGLDCKEMGENLFNKETHKFTYSKECEISGTAQITASDLSTNAKLADITAGATSCTCVVNFSNDLVINSFSGGINYEVEDINIDPVEIKNLPEILQDPGTSLEVTNPQLYLAISNPFKDNNITATATLSITGNSTFEKALTLDKKENTKVLSPKNESLYYRTFDWESFPKLGEILSGAKIPDALTIKVLNPALKADNVTDFELGKIHKGFKGTWEFYSKLSLTENTKVKYTKVWDDWGSKDLNGLTVEKAVVTFNFNKDVVLDAESITFTLLGKTGKLVGTTTDVKGNANEISVTMSDGPIKDIYGGKLEVKLKGQGEEINTNQKIEVSNLLMKVDGYYDKEF